MKDGCCSDMKMDTFYGLEVHLHNYSNNAPEYKELYCYWVIRKKEYTQRLQASIQSFPSYSLHDASHSEKIVQAIELLLGEDRIRLLSATDTWLLLECSYAHDIGMAVSKETFTNDLLNEDNGFYSWVEDICIRETGPLFEAANFLKPLFWRIGKQCSKDTLNDEFAEPEADQLKAFYDSPYALWPIKFKNAFNTLAQEYYRPQHAEMSKKRIDMLIENANTPRIIPLRLHYLVGEISALHTASREKILDLDVVTSGIGNDYAHPRFAATMLRLGDLLDIDSDRFNPYNLEVTGHINYSSMVHQAKHMAISKLQISPKRVLVEANFKTKSIQNNLRNITKSDRIHVISDEDYENVRKICIAAVKALKDWLKLLKEELEFFGVHWFDIIPKGFPGAAPLYTDETIRMDGIILDKDEYDFCYAIDTKRAAELIEGNGIYRYPGLVFIRELVQNALDASKMQLILDLKRNHYPYLWFSTIHQECDSNKIAEIFYAKMNEYTPYQLITELGREMERYRVEIVVEQFSEKKRSFVEDETNNPNAKESGIRISIRDHGIGISLKQLRNMKHIGKSTPPEFIKIHRMMPAWLRPTGSFGFGMQSIFQNVKEFYLLSVSSLEMETEDVRGRRATFYTARMGGEINASIMKADEAELFGVGTEIKVEIAEAEVPTFLKNSQKSTKQYQSDYFGSYLKNVKARIKAYLEENYRFVGFPVNLVTVSGCATDKLEVSKAQENYSKNLYSLFGEFLLSRRNGKVHFQKVKEAPNDIDISGERLFSYWEDTYKILIRYQIPKTKDLSLATQAKIFFKGFLVSMDEETLIRIPLWNTEIHILGLEVRRYLKVSREEFIPEKVSELAEMIRKTHLKCLNTIKRLIDGEGATEGLEELKAFFASNEYSAQSLYLLLFGGRVILPWDEAKEQKEADYFKTLFGRIDKRNSPDYMQIIPREVVKFGTDSSHLYATLINVGASPAFWSKIPEWIISETFFAIHEMDIEMYSVDTIPEYNQVGYLTVMPDYWEPYTEFALYRIILFKQLFQNRFSPNEMIYRLARRTKGLVEMSTQDYWRYAVGLAEQAFNEYKDIDGRIVLPGTREYRDLCVTEIPQAMQNRYNRRFRSWLICPFSFDQLRSCVKAYEDFKSNEREYSQLKGEDILYRSLLGSLSRHDCVSKCHETEPENALVEYVMRHKLTDMSIGREYIIQNYKEWTYSFCQEFCKTSEVWKTVMQNTI
jgi:hypothetical protein